jgi:hypothetical protein
MKQIYIPPKQGWFGQIFDSILILVLVYASLMVPLFISSDDGEAVDTEMVEVVAPTWQSLDVSPVEQQQWEKLGYEPETAAVIINDKFDYTIHPVSLLITAAVIIGYFFFMIKVSEKEYREVIAEKFGDQ